MTAPPLDRASELRPHPRNDPFPVFIQSRGFKTLKSRTRCLKSTSERSAETQHIAPSFVKGFLLQDRGTDVENLDKLMKTKNIPEAHQDAFKTGFAEGFLKAQALTQKTNGEAKANAPCVIFIDELDSVGGKRIESPMHPYSRQTINQLLAEMDGFKPNGGVIIIGYTSFPETLNKY
ncbi:ATP-dependent zinc metalloprotease YME1L1 [Manis javanica]|nr:ATP-dependent zinc metalloprotease YME1L1 [Manis javanica]